MSTAVLIGRFQPVHRGHLDLIRAAAAQAARLVFILGSANGPRSLRNPFTPAEREAMIRAAVQDDPSMRGRELHFAGVRDYFYNDEGWINEVREKVRAAANGPVILTGYKKDLSSSYLDWFPDWQRLEVAGTTETHATIIREDFLRDVRNLEKETALPTAVKSWLSAFATRPEYKSLQEEQLSIDAYKKSWAAAPFPPVFVTADALLVCCGHILLIQRKRTPGKGLWASPGGFLDPHERISDAAIRELHEETNVEVPPAELKAALTAVKVFDHPLRSSRGRTITHAYLFRLNRKQLPAFKASDDAAAAKWVPVMDLGKMEDVLFEDHFHVIHSMISG